MSQEENLTSSSLEELIATSSMNTDTTNQYTLTFPQTPPTTSTSLPQAYPQEQSSMQVQPISQQQSISQQQILPQQSQQQVLPQQSQQPLLMLQPEQSSQSHAQPLPPQPIITTVTIIPSAKKSKAKTSSTTNVYTSKSPKYKPIRPKITVKPSFVPVTTAVPASSFIFPNTFDINAKNGTIKKEPLTTPVLAAPESIAVVDSYPSNDDICRQVVCDMLPKDACRQICDLQSANAAIPIVTAPVSLQRQRSFRDRYNSIFLTSL